MTNNQINTRYRLTKEQILDERPHACYNCGIPRFITPSHTIAQKDCKNYGHPELIWDEDNIELLCIPCHERWERRDRTLKIFPRLIKYVEDTCNRLKIEGLYERYQYTSEK